ncbi:MAG TPA: glycoside hydrolase family 38 C-terminal domain-containing protein, partial [Vicinamibacterales bacterium]
RFLLEDEDFVANYVETHRGSAELADFERFIKDGRIEIASTWAAIFQGLPDGEIHARNLLLGKRFAKTVFGVDPQVAHLGDLPDYTPQYPQILAEADVPYTIMTRMGPADTSLFRWRAPDGSTVLTWNTLKGYGWGTFLTSKQSDADKAARLKKDLQDVRETTKGPILMHWGTDLWAPPDDLLGAVAWANRQEVGRFIVSTPADFFRRVAGEHVPERSGEINTSWPNIVASLPHLWPPLIPATNTLITAEKFATINYALGYADYPQQEFDRLWKKLVESTDHNHDGQGGSIGDDRKREYETMSLVDGGEILRDMLRNIAERVRVPVAKSFPIVVFNALSWTRDDLVRAHVTLYGEVAPAEIAAYKKGLRLVDETGAAVPFHVDQYSENISRAVELVFVARGVPPLGYKTYFLIADPQPVPEAAAVKVTLDRENDLKEPRRPLGSDVLENEFLRVSVDKATGRVTAFDKTLNREICRDMEVAAVEERGGNYIGVEPPTGRTFYNAVRSVDLEENDSMRATLTIAGEVAGVPVTQRLTLYRGLDRLDIENTVEWTAPRFVRLEQRFPLEQQNASITYGVPFGANTADNIIPNSGTHMPDEIKPESWRTARHIHDWIHAGDGSWGLTVATDHQFVRIGGDLIRGEMVRGTRFTSVKVVRENEVASLFYPPPGTYVFRYSIAASGGDWKRAKAYRTGMAFNNPLRPVSVVDAVSPKTLPPSQSFLSLDADDVVISTLKKAEDGRAVLVRMYEIEGTGAHSSVEFLGQRRRFRDVSLLEEERGREDQLALRIRPYEIRTITIR